MSFSTPRHWRGDRESIRIIIYIDSWSAPGMTREKMRQDRVIKCIQCGQDFVWTQEEQEFYAAKALKPPVRCPVCRAAFDQAKKDKFRGKLTKI